MFRKPKGTKDIYGKNAFLFKKVESAFFNVFNSWNYKYIETPIFESSNLFKRTSGNSSDIVNKEMYLFKDKSEREMALRPEGTAPVVRSIIENKFYLENEKYAYFGPMFRYERPQKGRFRQFYQAGIEHINKSSYLNDFEVLTLAITFLEKLKIKDYVLEINYLGTKSNREKYSNELKKYLLNYKKLLEPDSINRLESNPLRILDDKKEQEKDFIKKSPKIIDFIDKEQLANFNNLVKMLEMNQIQYKINPYLVRGLDYYDELVFEFVSNSESLGSKSTIIAGGRYNNLFTELSGPNLSAIGLGIGVERIAEILEFNNSFKFEEKIDIYVASFNEDELLVNNSLMYQLRRHNIKVEGNKEISKISKIFSKANALNAKFILFKEKNQDKNSLTLKNTNTNQNKEISIINFQDFIKEIHNEISK
ncbi:histidine--tRNA ligase [Mesomycoplasma molare]|uniref:Histidine--tRNA ligase n=1 Tax=Mesomycoplasma molare TaxID=171288 RepID=A0ABY5TVI9_9BACT|nr:histidine--tRNA ligase [Mesomycoplasma molare]UWD34349.1 histidine--tRNA ligase [Mesomycoplasma molare]